MRHSFQEDNGLAGTKSSNRIVGTYSILSRGPTTAIWRVGVGCGDEMRALEKEGERKHHFSTSARAGPTRTRSRTTRTHEKKNWSRSVIGFQPILFVPMQACVHKSWPNTDLCAALQCTQEEFFFSLHQGVFFYVQFCAQ